MSFLDLFSEKAHLYAAARPKYPDELFSYIASHTERNTAWDCGTGNGQAAISLAKHFEKVYATDPSAEQITYAFSHERVAYSVQSAERTTFAASSFDVVCVAQALHWFDRPAFFREVQRVAKPNAVFAAWGYDWFQVDPEFDACFKQTVRPAIEPFGALQLQLLMDGYANIDMPFPRIEVPLLEIVETWNLFQLLEYVHTWSATRACTRARGADALGPAEADLAKLWGPPEKPKRVVMPMHVVMGRVGSTSL